MFGFSLVTCHICSRSGPRAEESVNVPEALERAALPIAWWRYDLEGWTCPDCVKRGETADGDQATRAPGISQKEL
jgi:hypothetical protein